MIAASTPEVLAAVVAAPVRDLVSVALGALVVLALVARAPAARWGSLLVALAVAPLLLAGVVLTDDRAAAILDRPVLLLAAVAAASFLLAVAVAGLLRWPAALPVLIAVAIPLRLPLAIGGESVNLLLPLYGLVAASAVSAAVRARRRGRALARSWDLREQPSSSAESAGGAPEMRDPGRSVTGARTDRIAALVPVLLAASVAIYALRIPFSIDADRGVNTLCFFLVPFSALFLVLREVRWDGATLRRTALALAVLAIAAVALGDLEYLTGHVVWRANLVDESTLNATVRVSSLFFDPNIYGRFLMVVLLGTLAALAWGARGARMVGLALLFVLAWTGLFVTYSQSSMLGLLVGALVLLGLRFGPRPAMASAAALLATGVVAVAAFGGFLRVDPSSEGGLDVASAGRWALVKGGLELVADRPVLGWGSGGYRAAYRERTDVASPTTVAASHTIPVTVGAEQGVVGLLVYVGLLVVSLVALLRRAASSLPRAAIAAAYVALVVHSWLYAAFLEDPLTWALLAVGLGLGTGGVARGRTPHDVVGPVTLVGVGEGAGPGRAVGESGAPPDRPGGAHGAALHGRADAEAQSSASAHAVTGPVTEVRMGEGAGPGRSVGESGEAPGTPRAARGDGGADGPRA